MKKKILTISILFLISLIVLLKCSIIPKYNFKISITDAPAVDNFQEINIHFDRIEVSKAVEDGEEEDWIVINHEGVTVDLLKLTNGRLQELGVATLESGQYDQIRFYVSKSWVKVDDDIHDVYLVSNTITRVKPFTIREFIPTELIVDFDAAQSIEKVDGNYGMTPVMRIVQDDMTGAIKGKVISPVGLIITVSAIRYGETDVYASTFCDEDGNFLLGYLEPWTYNVVIEASGYSSYTTEGIIVDAGDIVDLGEIGLSEIVGYSITVDVIYSDTYFDGKTVYVTSFTEGGNIPDNEIETQSGTINGDSASIVLDNYGEWYADGTYEVRAHIDVNDDGILTAVKYKDYITLGEAIISGASAEATLNGPWGTYFSFGISNFNPPGEPGETHEKMLYLILVSQVDSWGNYTYAKNSAVLPAGVIGMGGWGPDGWYDLYALIDMDDSMASTGMPDSGDYVASIKNMKLVEGKFPNQLLNSWSIIE